MYFGLELCVQILLLQFDSCIRHTSSVIKKATTGLKKQNYFTSKSWILSGKGSCSQFPEENLVAPMPCNNEDFLRIHAIYQNIFLFKFTSINIRIVYRVHSRSMLLYRSTRRLYIQFRRAKLFWLDEEKIMFRVQNFTQIFKWWLHKKSLDSKLFVNKL